MTTTTKPPRSLRNEIAHALMEGYDWKVHEMRRALQAAQIAVDCIGGYVLVNGPEALIEAVSV